MTAMAERFSRTVERLSPTLFRLAGSLLLLLLVVGAAVRFSAVAIPRTAFWPLFPLAIALALGGLVGLYPRVARSARWSARVGGGLGALGVVLLLGGLSVLLMVSPPGPYPGSLGVLGAPFFLGLLVSVPATGLYGLSGLRTGSLSRRIGALLLLVALLQLGELVGAQLLFASAGTATPSLVFLVFEIVVYGAIATALVAVGSSLRGDVAATEGSVGVPEPRADAS